MKDKIIKFKILILGAALIAAIISCYVIYKYVIYKPLINDHIPKQIDKCSDQTVVAVVYSLRTDPQSWTSDSYNLSYGNAVKIWVANEDYGLNIGLGSDISNGAKYDMSDECRALLYSATQDWRTNYVTTKLKEE